MKKLILFLLLTSMIGCTKDIKSDPPIPRRKEKEVPPMVSSFDRSVLNIKNESSYFI